MRRGALAIAAGVLVIGVLAAGSLFLAPQDQQIVVMRLGAPVRVVDGGASSFLQLKAPFVDSLIRLDRRSLWLARDGFSAVSADGRPLAAGAIVRYRIVDALGFVRSVGSERALADRLTPMLGAAAHAALASASYQQILGGDRAAIDGKALALTRDEAQAARLGVAIDAVQVADIAPTPSEGEAIQARMAQGFSGEADQMRDEGKAQARAIDAKGKAAAAEALAQATGQAAAIATDQEAQVGRIYAQSFGADPGFAAFWRSMEAYRKTLADGSAVLVLSPDSPWLRYLVRPPPGR
ncbi:MAG TPA: SPFH domain-containing protein [Caulobacteraceae bacterium]|nr:SPFH domain-containing protein [Caulobacteraceae bacterium]